ncbi:hypothetical protein VB735_21270 [Halotia wernerae UHCC 0503]|nr:hypothetical protein [Halotia wernerae UHCC 0503]
MAKIIVYDLHHTDVKMFLHDLNIGKTNTILGGFLQSLVGGYSDVLLTTIHDGINQQSDSTDGLIGVDDNKVFTVDFSRITFNFIVV